MNYQTGDQTGNLYTPGYTTLSKKYTILFFKYQWLTLANFKYILLIQ
jgi:hypothetical protein